MGQKGKEGRRLEHIEFITQKPCLPLMWKYIDINHSLNINDSLLEFNESSFTVINEVSEKLFQIEDAAKIVLEKGESIFETMMTKYSVFFSYYNRE